MVEINKWADKALYVANQMSMSYFQKCPLLCQQFPSKRLFCFWSVQFGQVNHVGTANLPKLVPQTVKSSSVTG